MKLFKISLFALLVFGLNCAKEEKIEIEKIIEKPEFTKAVAVVHPLGDSGVMGTVHFTAAENGVNVKAEISGLEPGKHGFHVHQYGDCTAPDGKSAGGHYNPADHEHSGPEEMMRHMGDMGNITADENGVATIDYVDNDIMMDMIIGRGVIVHAGEDDLTSQPSGAAGARLGCGVIGVQQ
ncbi:MAG TPA: superoxide dismutase family protein [Balneolaceae bacterium]|nr:superoxide dismutase family protein [Balneolaceae bacterium]|tara:strand:+ start:38062 stop:38601 length:540 start_codon:yes stop_codon:yes gene_type:complete